MRRFHFGGVGWPDERLRQEWGTMPGWKLCGLLQQDMFLRYMCCSSLKLVRCIRNGETHESQEAIPHPLFGNAWALRLCYVAVAGESKCL